MNVEMTESHRQHAMECNNLAWALSDSPHRTPLQNEEMLHAAHASAYVESSAIASSACEMAERSEAAVNSSVS